MPFRHWFPNVLLALLGVAFLYTFCPGEARAQLRECAPLASILAKIKDDSVLFVLRVLEGDQLRVAADYYNAIPPETFLDWDTAYFAIRQDGFGMLMVGFAGAVCEKEIFDPSMTRKFLLLLDGTPT